MMMQTESDKNRFVEIGADPARMSVFGNLKFDAPIKVIPAEVKEKLKTSLPFPNDARMFIAGSTRGGEHEIILDTFQNLMTYQANLRLILAPRHLDRIGEVRSMIEKRGLEYAMYSEIENRANDARVLLVDRIGVLNDLYAVSEIAFVGGTLVDIGGQNILEPVWAGIPVIYGPSIYNVKDSSDYIIEGNYGMMVHDSGELRQKLTAFLNGEIKYRTRSDENQMPSRAHKTAIRILESISSDATGVAQNNIK
jgi:tRNA (guanine-N7-)-methyltransferase